MITRLRNILGLQTTEQKLEEYSLLKGELDDINGMTDELAESYLSRVNGFNEVLKSDNYSPEIKESVQKRYNNFLDGQKKEVIGLVNRRHKVEKSISSILKDDKIKEAVNEFEVLNNAKRNYKEGAISKNIYNEIIKSKKGKVHYSDNFVFWGDKLLLIQRATDDGGANKWCLPGGHVDAGESHEKAAVRELVEETGIEVKNAVLAGVYENEDVMIEYYTSSVESEAEPSILLDSSEHQSYKWFDIYKESLDDMEFPFNMKENIKKILLPEEVEAKNISKAVNMFIDGYISKEVLSDIVKARTGYYSDNSENRRLKRVGQKYGTKGVKEQTSAEPKKEAPIKEYAKQASDEALNTALKQSDDNKVKQAAKEELNERKEGEEEDKADQPKENVSVDTEKKQEGKNSPISDKKENSASKEQRRKNFKDWFGDSKVVDKEGKPLVVYHGTDNNFDIFSGDKKRSAGTDGGFWFSNKAKVAHSYTEHANYNPKSYEQALISGDIHGDSIGNSSILPVYISMINPLVIDAKGKNARDIYGDKSKRVSIADLYNKAVNEGYDGLIVRNVNDTGSYESIESDIYGVIKPSQIKSAIGNEGTFNKDDNDITKSQTNQIKGGLADNMTVKEIADKHNVDVAKIKAQLSKGIVVEMEHTNDPKKAVEIALDHLVESSIYYDELEKVESNFDKKSNQK